MPTNTFTERDMTYWSIHNIPAIKREAYGLDNTVRLMPKKGSTVGGYTVTATSYALLAFLENGESAKEMDSIQKFLQEQHLSVGGFYSSHVGSSYQMNKMSCCDNSPFCNNCTYM